MPVVRMANILRIALILRFESVLFLAGVER